MDGRGTIFAAGKDGALVKSETVHMCFPYPVSQAIDDELLGNGMVAVECVATSRVVHVVLPRRWNKEVITAIIDASEAKRWSLMITFICVIEDCVKNFFDARFVEPLYCIAELLEMHPDFRPHTIRGLGSEIAHRAVAPIVKQWLPRPGSHGCGF